MKLTKLFIFIFLGIILVTYNTHGMNEEEFRANVKDMLNEKNSYSTRLKAVINLEYSGNPKAVPYLMHALKDKSFRCRFAAIHALGSLGGVEAINFLEQLWADLENAKREVLISEDYSNIVHQQAFVAAALYKLGNEKYVEFLYKSINSDNKTTRYSVAMALGMVNNKRSKEILYYVLKNDSMDLPKCGAAIALFELKDPDILDTIRNMLKKREGPPECFEGLIRENENRRGVRGP